MGILAEWHGHKFQVSSQSFRSFRDLVIKGGSTTKDKTTKKQSYVTRKNGSTTEINLTAILNMRLGVENVKAEAMAFVKEATDGAQDYFYTGASKLIACQLMLTSAQVEKIEMTASGTWVYCEVGLTFKQSTQFDVEKKETKNTTKATGKKLTKEDIKSQGGLTVEQQQTVINNANQLINNIVTAVKNAASAATSGLFGSDGTKKTQ